MNFYSEELEEDSDQENTSPFNSSYAPKMKQIRIQKIEAKPKAIDTTEKTKKKLISYAKNGGNFCDRLNL